MTAVPDIVTRRKSSPRRERTPYGALAAVCERIAADAETLTWPNPKYADDPVGFARDILGVELWEAQVEILESIRDHRNVTVRSGHKCGKSTALAVAALWFYCSFPNARVVMTAVKATQIDEVIWREVRRLYRGARYPIGGELHTVARSGLRDRKDDRQIWGITARDGEGLAGISGENILVLADEASGIHDRFFEVLGSSLAGSGGKVRKCYISNPTRTSGEFWRSHTSSANTFKRIHISSENTPNARGLRTIPGLAGPEWIAERKAEYGEESASYAVRVRGDFASALEGKIISSELIEMAVSAFDLVEASGPFQIGIDPAGEDERGDEVAIAVRRGFKMITVLAWAGLTAEATAAHAVALLAHYRDPREPVRPRIAVDTCGGIGARVAGALRAALEQAPDSFDLLQVRSDKKMWGSRDYDAVRDGLWGHAREWIKAGGVFSADKKLGEDLGAPSFEPDKSKRLVATDKKRLRAALGRSPDRGDAFCLATWGFASIETAGDREVDQATQEGRAAAPAHDEVHDDAPMTFDPYAGVWGGR